MTRAPNGRRPGGWRGGALEFVFLADDYPTKRGLRGNARPTLVTPLTGAFTKPICNEMLTETLVQRNVDAVAEASLAFVPHMAVACPDGKTVP